ncbi:MAG TPA: caspase family protein [Termitinemataceae bacterium]|nr:caspase family protein [Termitinemataceae bacterium]HOM23626.1 caspase family protein [Termitinemataceae bacterium]HPP99726.1 caspase family protein [Termitinemataceae bacterium]
MNNRILVDCFSWGRLLFIVRIIMVLGGGLTLGGCTIPEASQRVALVYGVADYPGSSNDLSAPTNDAANMAALFTRQGYTGTKRTDSDVTKAAILSDIKNLQGFSGLVVLYFSGHGTATSEGKAAIVPHDALQVSGQSVTLQEQNLITAVDLNAAFDGAGITHRVLILDSCYSGGFVDAGATTDGIPPLYGYLDGGTSRYGFFLGALGDAITAYVSYESSDSTVVLAAAGMGEYSWESKTSGGSPTGVFTYYLLRGASSGDADGDGYLTTTELYAYTASRIGADWNAYYQSYPADSTQYADFHPHVSGNAREYILFKKE